MQKYDNCVKCFAPLRGADACPSCGYRQSTYRALPHALAPFSILNNRYLLGGVIGNGGFGITYVALDMQTNRRCAIKEYMPSEYSTREGATYRVVPKSDTKSKAVFSQGRSRYIGEAQSLQACRSNPIVVDIWGYFEANNTAYIVMEYLNGQNLQEMANARGGRLPADFAENVLKIVGSAMIEVHRKQIVHRDIKPDNIFYTKDGSFKLLDFGSARDWVRAEKMQKGMSVLLTPGYAPPEQYSRAVNQGPWTDVYAMCATIYRLISGKKPLDGITRAKGVKQQTLRELDPSMSQKLSQVVQKGMEPEIKNRYQNFRELLNDLVKGPSGGRKEPITLDPVINRTVNGGGGNGVRAKKDPTQWLKNRKIWFSRKGKEKQSPPSGNRSPIIDPANKREPQPPPKLQPVSVYRAFVTFHPKIGKGEKKEIPAGEEIQIGRVPGACQLVIKDDNVSRVHCKLMYQAEKNEFRLADLSANGTYLGNGNRCEKSRYYTLKPGESFFVLSRKYMLKVSIEK